MKIKLTKTDLSKIEKWGRNYQDSFFWDKHDKDSLTYNKICKLLNVEGLQND